MELIHMICGIHAVGRTEGAEHLGWKIEIDNVDYLVALKAKFTSRDIHNDRIPLAVVGMSHHRGLKILFKRIVG